MKEILNSRVEFKNCSTYELGPALFDGKKFDLVFIGNVLRGLRDPIGALMAVRTVCRHRVIASTPVALGAPDPNALPRSIVSCEQQQKLGGYPMRRVSGSGFSPRIYRGGCERRRP